MTANEEDLQRTIEEQVAAFLDGDAGFESDDDEGVAYAEEACVQEACGEEACVEETYSVDPEVEVEHVEAKAASQPSIASNAWSRYVPSTDFSSMTKVSSGMSHELHHQKSSGNGMRSETHSASRSFASRTLASSGLTSSSYGRTQEHSNEALQPMIPPGFIPHAYPGMAWQQGPHHPVFPQPPPPPPLPDHMKALLHPEPEAKDVLDALQDLIQLHDNVLPGTAFEELYKLDGAYKDIVKAAGGPKRFVEQHADRFIWTLDGVPTGSVKLVESVSAANQSGSTWHAESYEAQHLPEGIAEKWLKGLLSWQKDGYLHANKVFKAISDWKSPEEAADFKATVESYGGLEDFVASRSEEFHWEHVRGQLNAKIYLAESHAQGRKCCDVLAEVLGWHDGTLLAAKVYKNLKEADPTNFEKHKKEIEDSGGVKKYVSWYPDRFDWYLANGPGTETVCLGASPIVDAIAELLELNGRTMLACRLLKELQSFRPAAHAACKKEVDEAGGIKKFIAQYPDRFNWVLTGGVGTEAVQLIEEAASDSEELVDTLTQLVKWHDGSILASRINIDWKAHYPDTYEIHKKNIAEIGGLKKLVAMHSDRFRWVSGSEDGKDTLCLVEGKPQTEALADTLVEILEWHSGSLLASKVFKELKAWKDPRHVEQARREVEEAGSLKKFLQHYPDRFEWVLHSEPGKEVVRLVKVEQKAAEPPIDTADRPDWSKYQ